MLISFATCLASDPLENLMRMLGAPSSLSPPTSSASPETRNEDEGPGIEAGDDVIDQSGEMSCFSADSLIEEARSITPSARFQGAKITTRGSSDSTVAIFFNASSSVRASKDQIWPSLAVEAVPEKGQTNSNVAVAHRAIPQITLTTYHEVIRSCYDYVATQSRKYQERRVRRSDRLIKQVTVRYQDNPFRAYLFRFLPMPGLNLSSVHSLQRDIAFQREILKLDLRNKFDLAWGVDSRQGAFLERPYTHYRLGCWKEQTICNVQDIVDHELSEVNQSAEELIKELAEVSDIERGFELLVSFVVDLLGRTTPAARIFSLKVELDFEKLSVSSRLTKIVIACFIFGLNFFFVYYTMLKGYSKGVKWQEDFLQQWILQLVLDMFIFETLQCMWFHFIVPNLVAKEVREVYGLVQSRIDVLCNPSHEEKQAICLNAPSYLFVSHRVAKHFPDLLESHIVLSYSNHLPGAAGRPWQEKLQAIREEEKERKSTVSTNYWLLHNIWSLLPRSFLVSLLVRVAAHFPLQIQSVVIRVLEPCILAGLTYAFYLFIDKPVYIIILVVAVVALVVMLVWDYIRVKQSMSYVEPEISVSWENESLSFVLGDLWSEDVISVSGSDDSNSRSNSTSSLDSSLLSEIRFSLGEDVRAAYASSWPAGDVKEDEETFDQTNSIDIKSLQRNSMAYSIRNIALSFKTDNSNSHSSTSTSDSSSSRDESKKTINDDNGSQKSSTSSSYESESSSSISIASHELLSK
eukprot:scaffold2103_cov172-Ochromonas_danica.AAC.1